MRAYEYFSRGSFGVRWTGWKNRLIALGLLIGLAGVGGAEAADDAAATFPPLGNGDIVAVTVFGHPDISGAFPIGPDGAIRLPLLGRMKADGLALDELGQAIQKRASEKLEYDVHVTTDIDTFRPIFVMGNVSDPGEYPYLPDMTVKTALAKAGGHPSLSQLPGNAALNIANAEVDLWRAQSELRNLLIRKAALEAMLAGKAELTLPKELEAFRQTPSVADQVARQNELAAADLKAMEEMRDNMMRQQEELDLETAALIEEGESLVRQSGLVGRELSKMQALADRGLTTSSRMLDLQQMQEAGQADRHRQSAFLSRARQEKLRLELRLSEFLSDLRRERLQERITVARDIDSTRATLEGAKTRLVALSENTTPTTFSDGFGEMKTHYEVTRNTGATPIMIQADENTKLLPGDIVEVTSEPAASVAQFATPEEPSAQTASTAEPADIGLHDRY